MVVHLQPEKTQPVTDTDTSLPERDLVFCDNGWLAGWWSLVRVAQVEGHVARRVAISVMMMEPLPGTYVMAGSVRVIRTSKCCEPKMSAPLNKSPCALQI